MTVWDVRGRPLLTSDANVVRAAAWARLVVLVAIGMVASLADRGHHGLTWLLLDLVWIPWATAVLLTADIPGRTFALLGGPVGDVAGLLAVQLTVQGAQRGALFGYLVVVTFATFTAGRAFAAALAAATIAMSVLASAVSPSDLGAGDLLPFSLALLAALGLARRSLTVHALASARAEGLRTKADVILATAVGAVVVTDEGGVVREANPSAERLMGGAEAVVGRACSDALALHAGARALDCSRGCPLLDLQDHDASQGVELWREGPTGEKQPVLARAVTLSTTDGTEVVHSLQDITRVKQAEEAKTLFLATASHELKTPLTVINGFAETLTNYDDLDPATKKLALAAILSRGRQLTRVVDRLLLSSRIDAGRVSLVTRAVSLPALLHERCDDLAQATNRTITCTTPEGLADVRGDADALITVLDHLLENALKYSPGESAVAVSAMQAEDGNVLVRVADQGIGMDDDQAAHCFEKFWQAESTDVRRFGGTGIGLYIVHSLVDAMGGRISVDSSTASGSTFTLSLAPAHDVPEPRDAGQIREFMKQIGVPSGSRT
jgi:signal transduction histidine kinase